MATVQSQCAHALADLKEILVPFVNFPVLFRCSACSATLTCTCFSGYYSVEEDILRNNHPHPDYFKPTFITEVPGICSICTGCVPKHAYGQAMYFSKFMQRYLPYHTLLPRRLFGQDIHDERSEEYRQLERQLKIDFGYLRTGKKWISETLLFNTIKSLLPAHQIVHHYRGHELQGLELDIFVPELKLAIEYQGQQHYKAFAHWGGENGLKKRRASDRKKRRLCKQLGYSLLVFHHREDLTDEAVRQKLMPLLAGLPAEPSHGDA